MSSEEIDLVRNLYDNLYDILNHKQKNLSYASPGQEDGGDEPGVSLKAGAKKMVTLMALPGIPINPENFDDALSPLNPYGDAAKAERFSRIMDAVPLISSNPLYESSEKKVSGGWEAVVNASRKIRDDPEATEKYNEEQAFLGEKHPEEPMTRLEAYTKYQGEYSKAQSDLRAAQINCDTSTPEGRKEWNKVKGVHQGKVDAAWNRWRVTGQKEAVERSLAILGTVLNDAATTIFARAKDAFEQASRSSELDEEREWRLVYAHTDDWASNDKHYTTMKITKDSKSLMKESEFDRLGAEAKFNKGLLSFSLDVEDKSKEEYVRVKATDVSIKFDFTCVNVYRNWIDTSIMAFDSWWITDLDKNKVSSGSLEKQDDEMLLPLIVNAFLVVKNVEITATWSEEDKKEIERALSVKGSAKFGPFQLCGQYDHHQGKENVTSKLIENAIKIEGSQILVVKASVPPAGPPRDGRQK